MKKTLSCIAAFVPIVSIIVGFVLLTIGSILTESPGEGVGLVLAISALLMVVIGVIMCWVDIFWFIYMACKKTSWSTEKKIVWSVILYCFNIFVFPVFWCLHIRTT